MKKAILPLFFVFFLSAAASASLDFTATTLGAGGASAARFNDASSIFSNPAGIGLMDGEKAVFSSKVSEGEHSVFGGAARTGFGGFGIGFINKALPGAISGGVARDTEYQSLVLSFARDFNRFVEIPKIFGIFDPGRVAVGANLKLVRSYYTLASGLSKANDPLINLDIGALIRPTPDLSAGLSVRNLMSSTSRNGVSRAGIAAGISADFLDDRITLSLDNDGRAGAQFIPHPLVAVRAGRMGERNTLGIGILQKGFGIDYAYQDAESAAHYIAVSLSFYQQEKERELTEEDRKYLLYDQ